MTACPTCGAQNPERARFCLDCAAPLRIASAFREARKTVTVVFADAVGSTALGEQLDPESLRSLMARYFTEIEGVIGRHGGTVEKFIGDAVMAVFGIPVVHEDDALRAVRAAVDIRSKLAALDAELRAARGVTITFRTGIATGEVVSGGSAGQTLVTGDTVNSAARLQQEAQPGEILIGSATYGLVRDAVEIEPVPPVVAKGKAEPLVAYRLVAVSGAEGHLRRLSTPLLGRDRELELLQGAYRRAVSEAACQVVTVIGAAGVGKSRLVAEFLDSVASDASVLRGRCLPYGDGITYWPLREIVQAAAGIDDEDVGAMATAKVLALVEGVADGELICRRVASAIGLSADAAPQDEIFWATRRLLERLSAEHPLVVAIEDIHWAEPALLDLLEYVVDLSAAIPLVLVCPARPELNDVRPGWMRDRSGAVTVRLESLGDSTTGELIEALPGGAAVPAELRDRIVERAEGNPLFVEEMLGMLVDEGHVEQVDGRWRWSSDLADVSVPASIGVLLSARIESLPMSERAVAECASVIGRVFEVAGLRELVGAGPAATLGRDLMALVRKELIRPDRAELTPGDAFKFRHVLIRDAAYASLPKLERAVLHEAFAHWLERAAADRVGEFAAIIGYHLDQAHGYRSELGPADPQTARLAEEAGAWMARAAADAWKRGDVIATKRLSDRAIELLPEDDPERCRAMIAVGDALCSGGEIPQGIAWLDRAVLAAGTDAHLAAEAQLYRTSFNELVDPIEYGELRARYASLLRTFDSVGDHRLACHTWRFLGELYRSAGSPRRALAAYRRAERCAEGVDDRDLRTMVRLDLVGVGILSTMTISEALSILDETDSGPAISTANRVLANLHRGYALGLAGRFEEARACLAQVEKGDLELGSSPHHGWLTWANVEMFAGDAAASARQYRRAMDIRLDQGSGEDPFAAARLARPLLLLGRDDEAMELADRVLSELPDDIWIALIAGGTRARILARRGHHRHAVDDLGGAIERARRARFEALPIIFGEALEDLAEVLLADDQLERAHDVLHEAQALYERKGATALQARVRTRLATDMPTDR